MSLQVACEDWNSLGMALFVVNNCDADLPINSINWTSSKFIIDFRSFTDEGKPVALFDQFSQLNWMVGSRVVLDFNSNLSQPISVPLVCVRMALWVVENCEIAAQIGWLEGHLLSENVISA